MYKRQVDEVRVGTSCFTACLRACFVVVGVSSLDQVWCLLSFVRAHTEGARCNNSKKKRSFGVEAQFLVLLPPLSKGTTIGYVMYDILL